MQLRQLASQIGYQNSRDTEQFMNALNGILTDTDTGAGRMMRGMGGMCGMMGRMGAINS